LTLLCLNHLRPLHRSSRISIYSAVLLLLLIFGSVLWNLDKLALGIRSSVQTSPHFDRPFFQACALTFFGFVGWESLSFFNDGLQNPQKDLKWIYGGSFVFISLSYLALSGTITGLALEGQKFGIQEGFLSMLPAGAIRISSLAITSLFLL